MLLNMLQSVTVINNFFLQVHTAPKQHNVYSKWHSKSVAFSNNMLICSQDELDPEYVPPRIRTTTCAARTTEPHPRRWHRKESLPLVLRGDPTDQHTLWYVWMNEADSVFSKEDSLVEVPICLSLNLAKSYCQDHYSKVSRHMNECYESLYVLYAICYVLLARCYV